MSADTAIQALKWITRPLDKLSAALASLLMGVIAILIIGQVVARYAFNSSIDLVLEVPRICFILIIYLAMPLAYREGMHVGMDLLSRLIPKKYLQFITRLTCLVVIAVIVQIIVLASDLMLQTWVQTMPTIDFPIGGFYAAVVYGSCHLLLHVFQSLIVGDFGQSAVMSE
jgi:TRAP-type transport system small permease protein